MVMNLPLEPRGQSLPFTKNVTHGSIRNLKLAGKSLRIGSTRRNTKAEFLLLADMCSFQP
jgi:hypothetical protein